MSTQRALTSRSLARTNTFQRPGLAAFSQASMIIEGLEDVIGDRKEYSESLLLVPCVIVPAWLLAALLVPVYLVDATARSSSLVTACAMIPLAAPILGSTAALLLVAAKRWIGRFQVASYSLMAGGVLQRSSALTILHKAASLPFLDALMGTRFASWYMRALGARIGQDVFLESMPMVQADLLVLGDRVTIAQSAQLLSLAVENGCVDFLEVEVQADATVGPRTYVLPCGTLEERAGVGAMSVVMKGETVGRGMYAEGSPLVFVGEYYNPAAPKPGPDPDHLKLVETLQRDAKLPEGLVPSMLPPARSGPAEVVLLTGATGFVGGFLLRDLLRPERGIKKVYCLVRAKSPAEGLERLRKQLQHHELCNGKEWKKRFEGRVVVLPGDLGAPSLGLDAATLAKLADEVDVVVNNGALVNVTKGYETMRSSNVGAVLELIKLCASGSALTTLHQISTVGTLPRRTGKLLREDFVADDPSYLFSGYDQTKWVGEQLVLAASRAGLPVGLHRLGRIGGDTASGAANESDYCMLILKGCLQLQCFPKAYDLDLNIVPGDVAAKNIVDHALDPGATGRTYHVTNPAPPPFQMAVNVLRDMGYTFEEVPYGTWRERLVTCAANNNALRPLEGSFPKVRAPKGPPFMLDCSNAGIRGNTLTADQLRRDFEWCAKVGFFPPQQ